MRAMGELANRIHSAVHADSPLLPCAGHIHGESCGIRLVDQHNVRVDRARAAP